MFFRKAREIERLAAELEAAEDRANSWQMSYEELAEVAGCDLAAALAELATLKKRWEGAE